MHCLHNHETRTSKRLRQLLDIHGTEKLFSVVRQLMLDIRYLVQCMIVSISENVHYALNKTDKCGIQKNTDHMMMRIKGKEFQRMLVRLTRRKVHGMRHP